MLLFASLLELLEWNIALLESTLIEVRVDTWRSLIIEKDKKPSRERMPRRWYSLVKRGYKVKRKLRNGFKFQNWAGAWA